MLVNKEGLKMSKEENCLREWSAIRHYTKILKHPLLIGGNKHFQLRHSYRFETNQIKSLYHNFYNLDFNE